MFSSHEVPSGDSSLQKFTFLEERDLKWLCFARGLKCEQKEHQMENKEKNTYLGKEMILIGSICQCGNTRGPKLKNRLKEAQQSTRQCHLHSDVSGRYFVRGAGVEPMP